MVIFKYLPQSIEWKEMVSAGASSINSMMILAAKRKGSKAENITLAPYSVKEGDQFCVFNRDEICSGGKNVTETDPNFVVALPEEILLLELRKAIKLEKKSRKSVGFLDSFPKPGNRKEVTLSLGSNFDFSDEED